MKGIEYKTLLGLITVIIVVLLVIVLIVNPSLLFGKETEKSKEFREFCIFWSMHNYKEGPGEWVMVGGEPKLVDEMCAQAIGKLAPPLSADEVEQCRKICRGEV